MKKRPAFNRRFTQSVLLLISLICFPESGPVAGAEQSPAGQLYYALAGGAVLSGAGSPVRWNDYSTGLPGGARARGLYPAGNTLYLVTESSGIFSRSSGDTSWKAVNSPKFLSRGPGALSDEYRRISAFAADPLEPLNIAAATMHEVYLSRDGGRTWNRPPESGLHSRNYYTALALSGARRAVGSSFNGCFFPAKGTYTPQNKGLPQEKYSGNLHFTEEISAICFSGDSCWAGFLFGGGIRRLKTGATAWENAGPPDIQRFEAVERLVPSENGISAVFKGRTLFREEGADAWKAVPLPLPHSGLPGGTEELVLTEPGGAHSVFSFPVNRVRRPGPAAGKKALYVSVPSAKKSLESTISRMKAAGFNALVIDMKDDSGNVHFASKNAAVREIKAQRNTLDVPALLKKLKKNDIYSIARIVVFKDQRMFEARGGKHAIRDAKTGGPWKGTKNEYWLDPYSDFVREYNASLALELEKLGFDEIQFDYIRFPSDGPVHNCRYSHAPDPSAYKSEAINSFVRLAKSRLSVPVSVDIYGFNAWYHFGNWIGQDIEGLSKIADVICPMVYPSHFGPSFFMDGERKERPYRIVYHSGIRALSLAGGGAHIRPYLQAFRLHAPTWGEEYLKTQAAAAEDSGCSGYTYWNAGGEYETLFRAFTK